MSFVGNVLGSLTGANKQAKAAQQAAQTQAESAQAGIAEQRRQFDEIVKLMAPFVSGGAQAFEAQKNLAGLGGAGSQQAAIDAIQGSPMFTSLAGQGQNAILQNASATGGLRGGNVQNSLAGFNTNLLNSLIQQQFSNLGGLSSMGQASAAGQASAGQATGGNIANLLQQQGAALAGGQVAAGSAGRNAFGDILKLGGVIGGFF
jgi:hypothetical protein